MVCRKRGGLLNSDVFTYNGNRLEVVNDFNYLETVFNYAGNFSLNQQQLVGKGLKALMDKSQVIHVLWNCHLE